MVSGLKPEAACSVPFEATSQSDEIFMMAQTDGAAKELAVLGAAPRTAASGAAAAPISDGAVEYGAAGAASGRFTALLKQLGMPGRDVLADVAEVAGMALDAGAAPTVAALVLRVATVPPRGTLALWALVSELLRRDAAGFGTLFAPHLARALAASQCRCASSDRDSVFRLLEGWHDDAAIQVPSVVLRHAMEMLHVDRALGDLGKKPGTVKFVLDRARAVAGDGAQGRDLADVLLLRTRCSPHYALPALWRTAVTLRDHAGGSVGSALRSAVSGGALVACITRCRDKHPSVLEALHGSEAGWDAGDGSALLPQPPPLGGCEAWCDEPVVCKNLLVRAEKYKRKRKRRAERDGAGPAQAVTATAERAAAAAAVRADERSAVREERARKRACHETVVRNLQDAHGQSLVREGVLLYEAGDSWAGDRAFRGAAESMGLAEVPDAVALRERAKAAFASRRRAEWLALGRAREAVSVWHECPHQSEAAEAVRQERERTRQAEERARCAEARACELQAANVYLQGQLDTDGFDASGSSVWFGTKFLWRVQCPVLVAKLE